MFIAVHYVRINGVMFTPGEIITESMAPEKVAWLLGKGAIRRTAEAPISAPQAEAEGFVEADTGSGDAGDGSAEDAADETVEEADEEYEDAEPIEIDAADSITPPEESAEETHVSEKKPARKRKGGKESKA